MGYKTGMRRVGLGGVVACGVALAGCADDDAGVPAPGPVVPATGPTTIPAVPDEPGIAVRLLDPGAEPRRALRFTPRAGDAFELVYDAAITMTLDMGEHRMLNVDEQSRAVIGLRVDRIDADGNAVIELVVREMSDPAFDPSKPTRTTNRELAGKRGTFVVDPRGRLVSGNLPFLAEVGPDAAETLNIPDHLIALPDEPVGVGAAWEIRSTAVRRGLTIHNVDVHRLVALDATTMRTELHQTHDCPPQLMLEASRDPYTQMGIDGYQGGGGGTSEVTFDRIVPRANTLTFEATATMELRNPGMNGEMGMAMKVTVRGETR
jgi:hypothetical protein